MANHSFEPNARVRVSYSPETCQGMAAAEDICEPRQAAANTFDLIAGDEGIMCAHLCSGFNRRSSSFYLSFRLRVEILTLLLV